MRKSSMNESTAMTDRRDFLKLIPAACLSLALPGLLQAAPAQVSESDPQAQALGYRKNAKQVDKTRFPRYAPGQVCSNCALYQAGGACPLFAGRQVAANGWCSAYNRKA